MKGVDRNSQAPERVEMASLDIGQVQQWSDGSREERVAATATTDTGFYLGGYLGHWATVLDAKLKGVQLGWEEGVRIVALDSLGAMEGAHQLLAILPAHIVDRGRTERATDRSHDTHVGEGRL